MIREEKISIHALRAERDGRNVMTNDVRCIFQSTRSARSATFKRPDNPSGRIAISIHALREERDAFSGLSK